MSCPDWSRLLAHRFVADAEPPAEWPGARAHLQSCPACRAAAAVLDPTLSFAGAASWSPGSDDTEAVLQGVRTLRRAGALAAGGEITTREAGKPRSRLVAAGLFAVLFALLPGSTTQPGLETTDLSRLAVAPRAARLGAPPASALDGLDRPQARVYEWGGDDLSVVMVVDESLDV